METFLAALRLSAGYNTAVVSIGAGFLGAAAGAVGAFVLLRKRSLVSDAVGHATLPGLAAAFIIMAMVFGDGRILPGLLAGAAISAALGLFAVDWINHHTRLREDAAIGAVLSVFFGLGIVLLTIIQSLDTGHQAGIAGYLLGSTAGMLRSEAETIAIAAFVVALAVFALRRPFTLVAFDPEYAAVRGVNVRRTDLALMAILLAVTVIGLKVAGLVLIVALTIIPPVAARFWTERAPHMVMIAAILGAVSGYVGTSLSASAANLPTGAVIVLAAFALFVVSLLLSPVRGVVAGGLERMRLSRKVHERQGLLALARGEPIYDGLTLRVLRRAGHIRADGVATLQGRAAAAAAQREEALWSLYRREHPQSAAVSPALELNPIAEVLPPETVAALDRALPRVAVTAGQPA
jgi:manganese/zinc/iron transport system permease protein